MKKWVIKKPNAAAASKIASDCGITRLCAEVLTSRGIISSESAAEQIEVTELSDPFLIKDMTEAVSIINEAAENFEPICVFGDYDCDGVCASVMLFSYLECMGANVTYLLPERDEGYGLSADAVKRMHEAGTKLIITVDNGISAHAEAELAYSLGMRMVITDHHQPGETLPKAEAVINPHRKDCGSPFKYLCGAGVVLKLIAALEGGSYDTVMEEYGSLAALATIADIVPLTGENRYIARRGMKLMENSENSGLNALIKISGAKFPINSTSIAFGLAPRINASGRFGSPTLAARLLLAEDPDEAQMLAENLEYLNNQRKKAEEDIVKEAERQTSGSPLTTAKRVLVLSGEGWSHGVIGIVASKMVDRFDKPCFMITIEGDVSRGSARSAGGFHIYNALDYCSDLLIKYGGHPGAGGFSIDTVKIPEFERRLQEFAEKELSRMHIPELEADKLIDPVELTPENVGGLSVLEPFGEGCKPPVFAMLNGTVERLTPLSGGLHTRLRINFGGKPLDTLIFRISPDKLFIKPGDKADIMFTAAAQVYMGAERISIYIKDIRKSGMEQKKYFSALEAYEKYVRGEELPPAYYNSMCPSREDLKAVYKKASEGDFSTDTLYMELMGRINYCKLLLSLDIFSELGLVKRNCFTREVSVIKDAPKANLEDSSVLRAIKEKCSREVS